MKSFNFLKREQSIPPPPVEESKAKEPEISPTNTADTTVSTSSKFSFGSGSSNKKAKEEPQRNTVDTAVSTSSKFSFGSGSSSKKSKHQRLESNDGNHDEDLDHQTKKSKSRKRSCCSCKRLITSTICLTLLATIGLVTWRYGPWATNSANISSLVAATQDCEGCCNGLASNCNLAVNEVVFPMVHNAQSSYANNFVGASNNKGLEEALVAGYRGLQLSTCMCEGFLSKALLERDEEWGLGDSNLGFCDRSCGLGVRDPKDVLTNLKTFIETNTQEILIIEFTMNDGSSSDLHTALQYSGLLDHVYHPQDEYYIEEWPTMQQLIDDNTRILLFGSGDGMESCPAYDCDDGVLFAGDHFSRTETDGSDLDSCESTMSEGNVNVGYFLMNHYGENKMKMPSPKKARELNSYSNLEARMEECEDKRLPNLLAVEFWDEGDVLEFVDIKNSGKNREGGEFMLATPENVEDAEEKESIDSEDAERGLLRG